MRAVLAIVFAILCAGLFAALTAPPAHAEPPGLTIATPLTAAPWSTIQASESLSTIAPMPKRTSYRSQLAMVDGIGLVAGAALVVATGDEGGAGLVMGSYLFGAPIVHVANGHGWRALGSLALRAALPIAGAAIGARVTDGTGCTNCIDDNASFVKGLLVGATVGALVATVVDYGVIARPTRAVERGWAPAAVPIKGGATVGVSARF